MRRISSLQALHVCSLKSLLLYRPIAHGASLKVEADAGLHHPSAFGLYRHSHLWQSSQRSVSQWGICARSSSWHSYFSAKITIFDESSKEKAHIFASTAPNGREILPIMCHQNSQKIQQAVNCSEIREFWAFYNYLIINGLQNTLSKKPFVARGFSDLGCFTVPRRMNHHTI